MIYEKKDGHIGTSAGYISSDLYISHAILHSTALLLGDAPHTICFPHSEDCHHVQKKNGLSINVAFSVLLKTAIDVNEENNKKKEYLQQPITECCKNCNKPEGEIYSAFDLHTTSYFKS